MVPEGGGSMTTTEGTHWLIIEPTVGLQRKQLAEAIADMLGAEVAYHGTPKFLYQVGEIWIDRNWNIPLPPGRDDLNGAVKAAAARLGAHVTDPTANAQQVDTEATGADTAADSSVDGLTITIPIEGNVEVVEVNLTALLASKGELIARALGIPATPVEFGDGTVSFPWFETVPESEVVLAASTLLAAMVRYAAEATRVSAKPTPAGNDKYAMRCFLLRLGFIGKAHKPLRATLLLRLDGDAAWRHPKPKSEHKPEGIFP